MSKTQVTGSDGFDLFDDCGPCLPEYPVAADAFDLRELRKLLLCSASPASDALVHSACEDLGRRSLFRWNRL